MMNVYINISVDRDHKAVHIILPIFNKNNFSPSVNEYFFYTTLIRTRLM